MTFSSFSPLAMLRQTRGAAGALAGAILALAVSIAPHAAYAQAYPSSPDTLDFVAIAQLGKRARSRPRVGPRQQLAQRAEQLRRIRRRSATRPRGRPYASPLARTSRRSAAESR